jgi:hypothetical protein
MTEAGPGYYPAEFLEYESLIILFHPGAKIGINNRGEPGGHGCCQKEI